MGSVLFLVATLSSTFLQDVCGADLEHFLRSNFTNIDNMRQDDTFVYLENVHGVPTNEYVPGICNPNDARAQYRSIRLPRRPQKLAIPQCLPFGIVGIAINSVAFYHPLAGRHVNAVEGGTTEGFDICGGHADPTESYHYHKIPEKHLNPKERNSNLHAPEHDRCPYTVGEIDKMIGVALDGFFIYGPLVAIGGQVYDFRNSNTPANGIALDECHGIEIDAENQQYVYIANEVYPYIMGCYRGEPSLLNSFQMYECTAALSGSLCDCCEGQLSREDVTDDNEPCPYECTYQGMRVKRQIPDLLSDPQRGGMPFAHMMENQQPDNSLLQLFQRNNILPQINRKWYSFNRQSVEDNYAPNNEPVSGVIIPNDNNDHPDNEISHGTNSGVSEADLLHCMRGPPQDGQRPPVGGPPDQGGPPPKRGPPPNGGPPPKKAGGGGRDCSRNGLRFEGNRRKRAITESLQKLIRKLSVYS